MITLTLSKGFQCVIDDLDSDLSILKWSATCGKIEGKYAYRYFYENGNRRMVYLHRIIAERKYGPIPDGIKVDHKSRDSLDNRRGNIRLSTVSQNQINRGLDSSNTSGYKGVCWDKSRSKWICSIKHMGKVHFIGRYETADSAARAYDEKSVELFGEFAYLNFPMG